MKLRYVFGLLLAIVLLLFGLQYTKTYELAPTEAEAHSKATLNRAFEKR